MRQAGRTRGSDQAPANKILRALQIAPSKQATAVADAAEKLCEQVRRPDPLLPSVDERVPDVPAVYLVQHEQRLPKVDDFHPANSSAAAAGDINRNGRRAG